MVISVDNLSSILCNVIFILHHDTHSSGSDFELQSTSIPGQTMRKKLRKLKVQLIQILTWDKCYVLLLKRCKPKICNHDFLIILHDKNHL